PHRSGSLAALLSRFAARGLNLTKLESSPIPGRDFEFMFCIDLDAPVPEELPGLLNDIGDQVESLTVLGLYHEQK
ncbi:MAG: bifunctional chorismate mutase/prephenate dehydratase, partial [Clostridia bacterium]|nr:bifunctional chorismate mutase/prephenate dehydratase [Clostridia bacterium]